MSSFANDMDFLPKPDRYPLPWCVQCESRLDVVRCVVCEEHVCERCARHAEGRGLACQGCVVEVPDHACYLARADYETWLEHLTAEQEAA